MSEGSHRGSRVEGDVNSTSSRTNWQAERLGPATWEVLDEDSDVFLQQSLSTPCLNAIASASGSWIVDVEGRRYLDFHGNSVHQLGYGHPKVIQAIKDQLDVLPFCPRRYTNEPAVRLAQRLVELARPGIGKVLFAPGGAEAVSMALKLARIATGRHKTVSMWDSFHGATLDTISVGGESAFRQGIGPLMAGGEHVPPADPRRCPLGCAPKCTLACAAYLEYVLEREGDVCAVIAEPVRCTTAVQPPDGYWRRIRDACDWHGTLLIFDEIPTCLGRTGAMFATELTGVVPDMIVIGKGLGGAAFPMAALLAHDELDVGGSTALGHFTHEKSPVGCAAALATLEAIEDESLLERCRASGEWFVHALKGVAAKRASILEVRGIGLLVAVELCDADTAEATMYESLTRGLSFKVSAGNVLTLTPPINISQEDLATAVDVLDRSLEAVEREKSS